MACTNPDAGAPGKEEGPTSEDELGRFAERVREAVGNVQVRTFARTAGVSEKSLRQYMAGTTEPTRRALVGIADTAGYSVHWLATGEGPKTVAELERMAGKVQRATDAAMLFAVRRSTVTREDLHRLQEEAFRQQLDVEGLELRYGSQYPQPPAIAGDRVSNYGVLDLQLLAAAIEEVRSAVDLDKNPRDAARLIALAYDYMRGKRSDDREAMRSFVAELVKWAW